jgi:hypothetical protein
VVWDSFRKEVREWAQLSSWHKSRLFLVAVELFEVSTARIFYVRIDGGVNISFAPQTAQLPPWTEMLNFHIAFHAYSSVSRIVHGSRDMTDFGRNALIHGGGLGPLSFDQRAMLLHLIREPTISTAFGDILSGATDIFKVCMWRRAP